MDAGFISAHPSTCRCLIKTDGNPQLVLRHPGTQPRLAQAFAK